MTIARLTARWTGFSGAPGYTNLLFDVPGVAVDVAKAFFDGMKTWIPSVVKIEIPNQGDLLSEATGVLEGTWSGGLAQTVQGLGTGVGPAPAGACISWYSGDVAQGRRVRGRTFIVPLTSNAYEADGTLQAAVVSSLSTSAQGMIDASGVNFGIWHRPRNGAGGSFHVATSARVKDQAAVLRSRRS